jgi:hypothetical protein
MSRITGDKLEHIPYVSKYCLVISFLEQMEEFKLCQELYDGIMGLLTKCFLLHREEAARLIDKSLTIYRKCNQKETK